MPNSATARCRHQARTVIPLDCARCAVRDLAVCAALPEPEVDSLERYASSLELQANAELARSGQPCRHV